MRRWWVLLSSIAGLSGALTASAQEPPLWELGAGAGSFYAPYYRGAKTGQGYVLPFPYVVYRGRRLRVDDAGVRGELAHAGRTKVDISLAGGVPVPSNGDGPRSGMPKLDPTVELGPSLGVALMGYERARDSLWLHFPIRAAYSLGHGGVDHQGWISSPYIEYVHRLGGGTDWWKTGLSIGPMYADKRYHDYFYEVDAAYANATRPEYHPQAGYSGSRITLTVQRRVNNVWCGVFARYDNLQGAVFTDSPLAAARNYLAVGFGIAWVIAQSSATAAPAPATQPAP